MTKLRQRQRLKARAHPTRPGRPPRSQAAPPDAVLGGWTREQVRAGGALLAQDLHRAAAKAQALARGGYPATEAGGRFLAPLKYVYQAMDAISAAVRTQLPSALSPACAPGCYSCCRLYVEVGVWEAFGIADYVLRACEASPVSREDVLALLRQEVTCYVQSGGEKGAMRLCAFLSREGTCGIYPARPASCRSYYSHSRSACERYFAQPDLGETSHPSAVRTLDQGLAAQLMLAETLPGPFSA